MMDNRTDFVALHAVSGECGNTLHLLTPSVHLQLPLPPLPPQVQRLEEFLPQLAQCGVPGQSRSLLLLESSLPEDWLSLPWETLHLAGKPLVQQFLIVRRAAWSDPLPSAQSMSSTSSTQPAGLLNLFPETEYDFLRELQPEFSSGQIKLCRHSGLAKELPVLEELFIVAHGRADGLHDKAGQLFQLPRVQPMPARVWLLACNVEGAMHRLTDDLLQQGCRTVVVARGDLSAPAMSSLIRSWATWRREFPEKQGELAHWLATCPSLAEGDARSLSLCGEVNLDGSPSADWNHLSWTLAHDARPHKSAPELGDEPCAEAFAQACAIFDAPQTWDITRQHLGPQLLWLAEKHDHERMAVLQQKLIEPDSPQACHALASAARRFGRYAEMAHHLVRGLRQLASHEPQAAVFWGSMANLLIDMDLPDAADCAIERHGLCRYPTAEESSSAEFKRLDWQSRTFAREGKISSALVALHKKRRQPKAGDGQRELAALLYHCAWELWKDGGLRDETDALAAEVLRLLQGTPTEKPVQSKASADYLLRALAAYAWATHEAQAMLLLKDWAARAQNRLHHNDPGPWGFILAFLHLADANVVSRTHFDTAIDSLETANYLLESAMFLGLAGQHEKAIRILTKFQTQREQVIHELLPICQSYGLMEGDTLLVQARQRSQLEQAALGDARQMVEAGVLPL